MTRVLAAAGETADQTIDPTNPVDPTDPVNSAEVADPSPDEDAVPDKLYFRIGEVASLMGVDAHVLRYWETEFRMKPHRSNSGQRLYRKQDLSRFFRIKRLLHDQGYTIAGARKVLASTGGKSPVVDLPRLQEALEHVQRLRDRILELRDEMDPNGQA
ncbi:MAG: MerR family transcriptional regulator [Oligoflexia bacterium]|nr:MerR family transcriptional regulator [Oligoflexia bacterium]